MKKMMCLLVAAPRSDIYGGPYSIKDEFLEDKGADF
jgi:hypothetical protein